MVTGLRLNLSPLREPLGFIKILEWLAAIFAFASCGGYSGRTVVSLFCREGKNETLDTTFAYPFRLNQVLLVKNNATLCNRTVAETHLMGDSASSAEFFVAIGVLAFLYCMAALLVYLGYMHVYRDSDFGPMMDFVVTVIFAFLWLVCSSAWARGLQSVKDATGTVGIRDTLALCKVEGVACEVTEFAPMRSLNVSVVFGYLNLIIWASNAWFAYKETRWHAQRYSAQQGAGRGPVPTPI
ncbi:synaptophysin-like protein 1 [Megalops cyprinoides]|uniref:synaptophysin-like protein 1 n=1 Tax=Megalops cyprinoides TaxID=118141 RepID=UPI00186487C7|nr:synaptophysin-like protein 1 [Megalops cyprinoides]